MRTYLKRKLLSDVEGTCTGQYGYIICVLDNHKIDIGAGKIVPGVGLAEFTVKYQAIIFKPFKGEVVDATVTTVNKVTPNTPLCTKAPFILPFFEIFGGANGRWGFSRMLVLCRFSSRFI
jgi:SHS2 domain found in N terminus of Rpb7p/Rpc25p/MJ0397